jgi:hypothetical protein
MNQSTRVSLAEREEISRALAAGSRLRVMARQLERAAQHGRTGIAPGGADTEHLPGHARTTRRETLGPAAADAPDAPAPPGLRARAADAVLVAGARLPGG